MTDTVGDLGENELLEIIKERFRGAAKPGEVGPGDDAAVVFSPGPQLLYTTDALVEDVDFQRRYCTADDIAWKAIAVNVSDIAAMGGRPVHALATLFLTPATEIDLILRMIDGLEQAGRHFGVRVVGGDITRASDLALSIAMVGVAAGPPILRSTASIGESICVTGALGGAAGGLYLLRNGVAQLSRELAQRQIRPQARLEEGVRLAGAEASAMIDVSDGLLLDLSRLLTRSGVGCDVDPDLVPIDPALEVLASMPGAPLPLSLALGGGEDLELLCTLPTERVEPARASLAEIGTALTVIGKVTEGPMMVGGKSIEEWGDTGWDHLKN